MKSFLKKVSLYALGGLAMSATFTACIDNDEPYGIEQVRQEFANLLKSKAAVAAADAQYRLAQAEIERLKAETEKLTAEAQAKAAIAKAEADAAKAQAEAAASQAEADYWQAKADQIRAEYEMEMKERQAALDLLIAQNEQTIANLQIQIERAQIEWELEKAGLSGTLGNLLSVKYNNYFNALASYQVSYAQYIEALRAYEASLLDLNTQKYDDEHTLQANIDAAQNQLDAAENALALVQEELEAAKTMTPSELGARYTEVTNIIADYDQKIADLYVEYYSIQSDNKEVVDSIEYIIPDAQTALADSTIVMADYTLEVPDEISVPGFPTSEEIISEALANNTYSLGNTWNYNNAIATLTSKIDEVKDLFLDENDQLWTQVKIRELEENLANQEENVAALYTQWSTAVEALNPTGAVDYTKLEGADAIEAEIAAYNAEVPVVNALYKDYAQKYAAWQAAEKAWQDEVDATNEANTAAMNAIYQTRDDAYAAANAAYQTVYNTQDAKKQAAWDAFWVKNTELNAKEQNLYTKWQNAIQAYNDGAITAAELATAKKAYDDFAVTEVDGLTPYQKQMNDAWTALNTVLTAADKAIAKAAQVRNDAKADAYQVWRNALAAFVSETADPAVQASTLAAEQAQNDAWNAVDKEYWDVLYPLYAKIINEGLVNQINYYQVAYNPDNALAFDTEVNNSIVNLSGIADDETYEDYLLPTTSLDALAVYTQNPNEYQYLTNLVIEKSHELFGNGMIWGWDLNDKTADQLYQFLDIPQAQLIELTQEAANKIILAEPYTGWFGFYNMYDAFGTMGQIWKTKYQIQVATAFLNNTSILDDMLASLEGEKAALMAQFDEVKAKADALQDKLDELNAKMAALYAPYTQKMNILLLEQDGYEILQNAIAEAAAFTGQSDAENWTQATIDAYVEGLNDDVEYLEALIEQCKANLDRTKYIQDQYNQGQALASEINEMLFEIEEQKLAIAQARVDKAKAELDAVLKALGQTSEE